MKNFNIFSLVFDYNIKSLETSGRHWAKKAYVDKNFIFEYTAASVATFLHYNPNLEYQILTDDKDFLYSKMKKYSVSLENLNLIQDKDLIVSWMNKHEYGFWPLVEVVQHYINKDCGFLKLDNDLTCKKPIDDLLQHDGAFMWKFERNCNNGRDYWGEKYAAQTALGKTDFSIWNAGTLGCTKKWIECLRDIPEVCNKLANVDISSVSMFPEAPGLKAKTWNASEQTAVCYTLDKHKIPIKDTQDWFDHHCYGHDAKKDCIRSANHLLK